jgi:hypothetical protein
MSESSTVTESDIFAEVIPSAEEGLAPEVARSLLQWRFTERAVQRMNELAERNRQGTISTSEREELEKYLRVGSFVNIVHARARLSLKSAGTSPS